jgi:peptide/nickel transport system substrate-binding protein
VQTAASGTDPSMWRAHVGYFAPESPMASLDGLDALKEPPDLDHARRLLQNSGYDGARVVMLGSPLIPALFVAAQVIADAWRKIGFNVELAAGDVATMIQRLQKKGPVAEGGWSAETDLTAGMATFDPVSNSIMRSNGNGFGWANIPKLEELRGAWLAAPDQESRKEICRQIQLICFDQIPYLPTGMSLLPTSYAKSLNGVLRGVPLFWNVRRT